MTADGLAEPLTAAAYVVGSAALLVLSIAIAWVLVRRGFDRIEGKVTTKLGSLETKIEQTHNEAQTAAKAAAEAAQITANEFKPNGGSTARDALDRMEKSIGELRKGQAAIAGRLVAVEDFITNPKK